MEPKKTEKANLENKRGLFLQAGLIITLGLTLIAFEWYSPLDVAEVQSFSGVTFEELDATVITRPEKIEVIPPTKIVYPKITIVDDFDPASLINPGDLDITDFDHKIMYIPEIEEKDTFFVVEIMPKYHGGDETAFWNDINSRLKYPKLAQDMQIEGVVYVNFVINKKGKMTNIKIVRSNEPIFNDEVIRVLSSSDNWTPGYQRDKPVNVSYTMPFKFKLIH